MSLTKLNIFLTLACLTHWQMVTAGTVILRDSLVTLPCVKQIQKLDGTDGHPISLGLGILEGDRARAKLMKQRFDQSGSVAQHAAMPPPAPTVMVQNQAVSYIATVGVGSPATTYSLIVDTGSSNTFIGVGSTKYKQTSTSRKTNDNVQVSYGSGNFSGKEYVDSVSLGSNLVIGQQSIGVASSSNGFYDVDGILGIGPVDLTRGTLTTNRSATIPTVTDNLFSQGTIPKNLIGVSFQPSNQASVTNGEISFGGVDSGKYVGAITYTPITSAYPASQYWGLDQSITYGSSNVTILKKTSGIVDTGTTLLLIASDAYAVYKKQTGAVFDNATGFLSVTTSQYKNVQSLYFNIGAASFEFTRNAQTWPRNLNTYIGGVSNKVYLIVADLGTKSGQGFDFINGMAFHERFYVVYDTGNGRIGVARTGQTKSTVN